MSVPTVSVIVPAYKVTPHIEETLESIFAQTFKDFEVIVINDGCPDTAALEMVLKPYLDRIVYLKQENKGLAAARNAGLSAARAPYIALLDSDDIWMPHYLETQLQMLRDNPSADLVYGNGIFFGDPAFAGRIAMDLSPSNGEANFIAIIREDCCVAVSVLAKREAMERAGGFDVRLRRTEDFDMWVRLVKTGGRIVYHREPIVNYRRRPESLSADHLGMMDSLLFCLNNYLTELDLTASERSEVQTKIAQVMAKRNFREGLQVASSGEPDRAIRLLEKSQESSIPSPKVSMLIWGLRLVPNLVRDALRRRQA